MKIVIAKNSGFCQGVKKAVDTALNLKGDNNYILGELIHNSTVTKLIQDKGIKTINSLNEIDKGTVLIRSHGVGKDVILSAKNKNIKIIDCTCEFVKKIHNIVNKYYNDGYKIVIVGEKEHPEVIGINGWCENNSLIVSDENSDVNLNNYDKICIVSQTTFNEEKFDKILKIFMKDCDKTVEIFKTICYTTIKRQIEADKLSKECDAVIVLGGLNSSNTNKLYNICNKNCNNVFRAKSSTDLDYNKLNNFNKVAIVSGASTPNEQTQEVFLKMESNTKVEATTSNTMEDVVAKLDEGKTKFKKGQIITATISLANEDGLAVLLPINKKETLLPKEEVDTDTYNKADFADKIGDDIEVMVIGFDPLKLSQKAIKKVREEEALISSIRDGKEFSVVVDGFNKGGLTSKFGSYQIFVPAREIKNGFVKDLEKYVGKKLRLKSIEIKNDKKKEIIASQKVILEAERIEREAIKVAKEEAFFSSINVDDVIEGKVERFSSFGAFVSINGFDCLAHISDLSWNNINSADEILEIGKTYNFKVLKINQEAKKVSIGYKQLQPQPWDLVAEKYTEGDVVTGKVVRIVPFGAFVEVEKGIDGLVHVSQISYEWLENPTASLTIGQEIQAKILLLDTVNHKMTLSIKALLPQPETTTNFKPKKERVDFNNNNNSNNNNTNNNSDEQKRPRKPKVERKPKDDDEIREWNEGGFGGASIGEMLNLNK